MAVTESDFEVMAVAMSVKNFCTRLALECQSRSRRFNQSQQSASAALNAAVRMHNGLEIKLDEQQRLIQHSRAVTEPLPEEISPVATAIQPDSVLSAALGSFPEGLHSASEPMEVVENSFVFHSVRENRKIEQHEQQRAFNHQGTAESTHLCMSKSQSKAPHSVSTDSSGMTNGQGLVGLNAFKPIPLTENSDAYRLWEPKPIEGEPLTPEQFRVLLEEFSQRLSMPVQQHPPRVSEISEIEELNHWLADPLLRKEVMPRIMKGDRSTLEFDEDGEPLRVVESKPWIKT